MNSRDRSNLTVETLLALRSEPDALRTITERLQVKEMGPADHIRTKHEVKTFVENGNRTLAENLIERSHRRRMENQAIALKAKVTQRRHP